MTIDWKGMDDLILRVIGELEQHGYREPTIRSVYYVLGNVYHVIPLTKYGYKATDEKIVEMRKAGRIPWGFFAVKRGRTISSTPYNSPDTWARYWIERLKNAHKDYKLPRWYKQENLVEVWVEKDGLLGATAGWLQDLDVTTRAPQGYGAWEFINEAMNSIRDELEEQEKTRVHILYLSDLDPSGKDIPRFMSEDAIAHFQETLGVEELDFRDLGLSPEQAEEHNLPRDPDMLDAETLEKIRNDPRRRWYLERYPEMFVELDAFYSLAPDAARNLIRSAVEALFDEERLTETAADEIVRRREVKRIVDRQVRFIGGPA